MERMRSELTKNVYSEKERDRRTGSPVVRVGGEVGQGRTSWRKLGLLHSVRQEREFRKKWGQGGQQRPCLK